MKIIDFLNSKFKIKSKKIDNEKPLLEKYDDVTPREKSEILEGDRIKEFVRVDANFFGDMFDEIKNNPNCSYITYLNNLIKNDDVIPSYVSVLKKKVNSEENYLQTVENEILCSRIANAMGVSTVYNAKLESDDETYLLSVDFLEYGNKIINIDDWRNELSETRDIFIGNSEFVNQALEMEEIIQLHNLINSDNKWKIDENFRSSYLMHYLTRKIILNDNDAYSRNVCFVVDEDNNLSLGPMFDTEYAFSKNVMLKNNINDLIYAMKFLPETLKNFDEKYANLFSKQNLKTIFKGFDNRFIAERCNFMKKCYNQYKINYEKAKKMLGSNYERY